MTKSPDRLGAVIATLLRDHPHAHFYAHEWTEHEFPLQDFWFHSFSQGWRAIRRAHAVAVTVTMRSSGATIEITDPKAEPYEQTAYEIFW